jgi:hypothetical protein
MNAIGDLWTSIQKAIRQEDPETLKQIQRVVQGAYYKLCEIVDWQPLRRTIDVTIPADDTGALLPADCIGVLAVNDDSDEHCHNRPPYMPASAAQKRERFRKWYFAEAAVTPLFVGKAFNIQQSASAFTVNPAFDAAWIGEYIQIDDTPGFYKLTSTTTILPAYYGIMKQNAVVVVRPSTTKRLVVTNEHGEVHAKTVRVSYWAYPEPLCQAWQVPLLPNDRALYILAVTQDEIAPSIPVKQLAALKAEYPDALSTMWARNPKFVQPQPPRSHTGRVLSFGRRR